MRPRLLWRCSWRSIRTARSRTVATFVAASLLVTRAATGQVIEWIQTLPKLAVDLEDFIRTWRLGESGITDAEITQSLDGGDLAHARVARVGAGAHPAARRRRQVSIADAIQAALTARSVHFAAASNFAFASSTRGSLGATASA